MLMPVLVVASVESECIAQASQLGFPVCSHL